MAEWIPAPLPMVVKPQEGTSIELSSLDSGVFVFEETKHPCKLLGGLNSLRLSNMFCDVILCCERQEFPCHRNVLASFSSYFQGMFTTEWVETQQMRVPISGVEPQIMDALVTYGYTSKVAITAENVQALLAASDLLNVAAVHEACWHYMERRMDENNCVGIHILAEAHCHERLHKRSMAYILQHFSVVHRQEEFLSLSVEKLCEILSSDNVNVSREEQVFEAAMLWIEKCPTRKQSVAKVLKHIHLAEIFLTSSYLQDVIECVDVVKESPDCQRLISEAKSLDQLLLPYSIQPRWSTLSEQMLVLVEHAIDMRTNTWKYEITIESFDPMTKQWRTLGIAPFHHPLSLVASGGSDLYGVKGDGHMWCYDRSSDFWSEMAPMPIMEDNTNRIPKGLVMLDGYVYAMPTSNVQWPRPRPLTSVRRYDAHNNTWLMEAFGIPEMSSVVTLNGLIYFMGDDGDHTIYTYNPQTLVWLARTHVDDQALSTLCPLNGKIYLIGGMKRTGLIMDMVTCYNPETDQRTMCAHMKVQRLSPIVAVLDGKIYVLGGDMGSMSGDAGRTIERYCQETDTWEIVGKMPRTVTPFLQCVSFKLGKDANMTNLKPNLPMTP